MSNPVILTSPLKTMVPVIKVVGDFCNLRCRYCFYHSKSQSTRRVMSSELLDKFLSQYMGLFSGTLTFIWHGGEPLLAGLDFFQRAVDFQNRYLQNGQKVTNLVQTNATLVNEKWARFFENYNFGVGVSLDGNEESHNHYRLDRKGVGSFSKAIRGIEILRCYGIEPGIIQTLAHDNVGRAAEDFKFFMDILCIKTWGTNEYLDIDGMNKAMRNHEITNKELTHYLKQCVDFWLGRDDPELQIRQIENFIAGVLEKQARTCAFNGTCTSYFCIEHDGRVYPCDRLTHRNDLLFGDLSRQSLIEILNSPARLRYAEAVNSVYPDCAICEWQVACNNGCTYHRTGNISGKYFYCETRQAIFSYLREKIARIRGANSRLKLDSPDLAEQEVGRNEG